MTNIITARENAEGLRAILGPTNTGKTHYAIERMLSFDSGVIGLPLRLLAREVYARVAEKVGERKVALLTGEEKIQPDNARFFICTVEAMPEDIDTSFVAIDEVQLVADLDRGHIFTNRILNTRGRHETLLLGAETIRARLRALLPGLQIDTRPRLSTLAYAGSKKITRLPPRSAVVAFSAWEVYEIAELLRRQKGGATVVMGALSPRTRNAQVALFENGDVDYLVATDAIGMGLNLNVDHIAFAASRKFDGYFERALNPAELAQIAGRAGRYERNGTFGVTGRQIEFDEDVIKRIESHEFEQVKRLQWRNHALDFSTPTALFTSLNVLPKNENLTRAPQTTDQDVLEVALRDKELMTQIRSEEGVQLLWTACKIPDYRKLSTSAHADLCLEIGKFLLKNGEIDESWFSAHVKASSSVEGDIDTLSNRLSHIRTWSYVAHRADWLKNAAHWRNETRALEERLSDKLHACLVEKFVDRRTSLLMRRLKDKTVMQAEIQNSEVSVEGQRVGRLQGFQFTPEAVDDPVLAKTMRAAATPAISAAILSRAQLVAEATNDAFLLSTNGSIKWQGEDIARLIAGESELEPQVIILSDEHLSGTHKEWVDARVKAFVRHHISTLLKPLFDLRSGAGLEGIARGLAFQLVEALGILERTKVADDIKALDQTQRSALRSLGVRFGAHHIYAPLTLKPKPRALAAQLWALKNEGLDEGALQELQQLALSGRTSFAANAALPADAYRILGYKLMGTRVVRIDILERLSDIIRPITAYVPSTAQNFVPKGYAGKYHFTVTVEMTSLLGCSGEEFATILRGLGYKSQTKQRAQVEQIIKEAETTYFTAQAAAPEAQTIEVIEVPLATPANDDVKIDTPAVEETKSEEATAETITTTVETPQAEVPTTIEVWHFEVKRKEFPKRPRQQNENKEVAEGEQKRPFKKREHKKSDKPQETSGSTEKKPFKRKPQAKRDDGPRDKSKMSERRLVYSSETNTGLADPNSPFAKLATLKAQLDKSGT